MDGAAVIEFLNTNDEFLDKYVTDHVSTATLDRWMMKKLRNERGSDANVSVCRWKHCVHTDRGKMLEEITASIMDHPTQEQVLFELGRCISAAVGVDAFRMFKVQLNDIEKVEYLIKSEMDTEVVVKQLEDSYCSLVLDMALNTEAVRFNDGTLGVKKLGLGNIKHAMFQPIPHFNDETVAVLLMCRNDHMFYEEDARICSSYLVWGGIALHYAKLYHDMQLQRQLGDFLLTVVKSIFQDMVSMETLVTKVMSFAQKLVDAERASLFLVDTKAQELYATLFDVGNNAPEASNSSSDSVNSLKRGIRFPLGTGIAGHVAKTGEIMNIRDAYEDSRFNRTVDLLTGFKTKTILCMPIYIRNNIIGVVQMVNKKVGNFTKQDEKAFEMFAVYCGLALHHAKLYHKISRSEQKYKVALEVLSYHNRCADEEVRLALCDVLKPRCLDLNEFRFSPFIMDDQMKATHAIHMFIDLFELTNFDTHELLKFVLTVRKNYRRVPYHNWTHGFSVANSIYNILIRINVFTRNERLALFIGCLCHDLDHRGKSNKFMSDIESPLAAIYSTSTMEHHHFNQTVTILQQDGHNIFRQLSHSDYKQVLGLLKHCILATDLALFFPNKAKLESLVRDDQFQWDNQEHRNVLLAVSMTAADLSASAKPWDVQVETVKVIFQEFYQQGDEERAAGREPQPMMDRERPEQQANSQVGFLNSICIPCYSLLYDLMPETKPLLDMCKENLERWRDIEREVTQIMEQSKKQKRELVLPENLYLRIEKEEE